MRKSIIIGIIGFILLSNLTVATVTAEDPIKNLSDGDIFYVGGAGEGNYSTINEAIESASNGDTVFVFGNEIFYDENFVIDKSIDLLGEDKATTFLNGSYTNDVITIIADGVNISGFTIQNGRSGILVMANFSKISSNNILFNDIAGISLKGANNCTISRNKINENGHGIQLKDSDDNNDNLITNNILKSNIGYGLYLSEAHRNTIYRNNFDTNLVNGVRLWSSSNNAFYLNNFINNLENANVTDDVYNIWDNGVEGNYWDDYTGADLDEDGIGDTPYIVADGDNNDTFPLMEPVSSDLEVAINRGLGTGIYVSIKNKGRGFASDVKYDISVTGGFFGFINSSCEGVIPYIDTDNEEKVFISPFGIGLVKINITVDSINIEDHGLILGRYVFLPFLFKISPR